jgi:hypothetical protein
MKGIVVTERAAAPERCSHAFLAVALGTITFFATLGPISHRQGQARGDSKSFSSRLSPRAYRLPFLRRDTMFRLRTLGLALAVVASLILVRTGECAGSKGRNRLDAGGAGGTHRHCPVAAEGWG